MMAPPPATDHRERLATIVGQVRDRLAGLHVFLPEDDGLPLLEVTSALLRGCLDAADAVLRLSEHGYQGLHAVERAAWEHWKELEFLLARQTRFRDARKVQINATIEVLDFLRGRADTPPGMIERTQDTLAGQEREWPAEVAEVRDQRKRRKFHWSGESRSSVVAPAGSASDVYRLLSWESHPDVASIRDVTATRNGDEGDVTFHEPEDLQVMIDRSTWSTRKCLTRAWNVFASAWGLDQIDEET